MLTGNDVGGDWRNIPISLIGPSGKGFELRSLCAMILPTMVSDDPIFQPLKSYLATVPSVRDISSGFSDDGRWWVKFTIDIEHPLAWSVVQELGHVLNYVSLEERLPTVFMPVSPPPYMNGGPREFLSWVIESKSKDFQPKNCTEWLEGRLPRPVTDAEQWRINDDDSSS